MKIYFVKQKGKQTFIEIGENVVELILREIQGVHKVLLPLKIVITTEIFDIDGFCFFADSSSESNVCDEDIHRTSTCAPIVTLNISNRYFIFCYA